MTGDAVGLALVGALIERAAALPPNGRERLLARAEVLRAVYLARVAGEASAVRQTPPENRPRTDDEAWRERLDATRRARAPRSDFEGRATAIVAEIRAPAATARAAAQVPEAAGPYNGAAVVARALDELLALAPAYVGSYVAWLEDLASLAELPERPAPRRRAPP